MKKIKLLLLKIAEAPFAGIMHFVGFIDRIVDKPVLFKLSMLAYRIHCSLDDVYARTLGYKDFSDLFHVTLNSIAVNEDDPAERDTYDEDNEEEEDSNEI